MDLPEASERWSTFKKKLQALGIEPFCMSAVKSEGTHEVISAAYELVRKGIEDNKEGGWKFILVYPLYCIVDFFPSLHFNCCYFIFYFWVYDNLASFGSVVIKE